MTNTIDTFGQPCEVPMSNGQLEPRFERAYVDEDYMNQLCAITDGRCAKDIEPEHQADVEYLRNYVKGAMRSIDARLLMPTRLADAEVAILLEWAEFTAATVRRLRQLDEDLAKVGEW